MGFLDPNSWANALSSDPTGSKYAADVNSQSAANQLALQKLMWQYAQQVQAPFVQSGQLAANQLMAQTQPGGQFDQWTMDKMKQSVPYQTAMDPSNINDMMSNANAATAATGNFGSPAVANAMAQNLQTNALNTGNLGYAQWLDAYNRLASRANPNAAQAISGQGADYANNASNIMANAAQMQGFGQMSAMAGRNAATSNLGSSFGNFLGDYLKGQSMGNVAGGVNSLSSGSLSPGAVAVSPYLDTTGSGNAGMADAISAWMSSGA